jgi:hypothetical protein
MVPLNAVKMKTLACLTLLCLGQFVAQAQQMFGGKTEGGGPGGSPDTNCPCWRFPVRVLNNRIYDLRPLFAWWRDNYEAYKGAVDAGRAAQQAPDFSALPPPPLPGWHRIKEGHFVSEAAYGWLCDVVIEDYPSHTVSNRILVYDPPKSDRTAWDELVAQYEELKEEPASPNTTPKHNRPYGRSLTAQQQQNQYQYQTTGQIPTNALPAARKPHESPADKILDELKKFPQGTNYTIDLFAYKLGYLQDGSHRQVYDLGQIRAP